MIKKKASSEQRLKKPYGLNAHTVFSRDVRIYMKTDFIEISNQVQNDTQNVCRKFYENAELYAKKFNDKDLGKR